MCAWAAKQPLIYQKQQRRLHILAVLQELVSALADEVDPSQIPTDYGGTMAHSLNQCELELQIREAAEKLTRHAN